MNRAGMCVTLRLKRHGLMAGAAIVILSGAASAAYAADNTAASSAQQVSEVVVTAQKRSERLLSVAAPVTAITSADLTRAAAVRLEDYAASVPGLNLISDRTGETQIVLRGVTTGSPVSSTVATYVDDTPYGSSTSAALGGWLQPDLDPSDIQRVEVLRGPQGTLYGASALGGLIKYVTIQPNLTDMGGRVEVDASTVDHGGDGYGVRGMVNLPIVTDTLALRVSAYSRRDPGYIDNPQLGASNVNSTEVDGGRASLLWKPTAAFSLALDAVLQDLRSKASSDEDVNVTGGSITPVTGALQQTRYTNEALNLNDRVYSATINDDLRWANLTSITSYTTLRQTGTVDETQTYGAIATFLTGIPNFGTSTGSVLTQDKWTEEVRLASPSGQTLEWLTGLFYDRETSNRDEPTAAFSTTTGAQLLPPNTLFFANLRSRYTEYAAFGDVTYHFTPRFDVQAGVRFSHNDQTFSLSETGVFVGGPSAQAGDSSDNSVTYLLAPRFRFDDNTMVYGRIASGYRPGGPNAPTPSDLAAGVPAAYKPDTLTNYEVGYKASLADHKLTLDLSAFYIDWRDIQIETDFNGITSNGNGGTASSKGFEASAVLTPIHGLTLSGNATYTDAHLTENAPGVNGRDGDALPNVPKWAGNLSADYDFPIGGGSSGFVGGTVRYLGDRASGFITGSPAGFQRPTLPAYTTVDLRAGVTHQRLSLELYVKNVGDTRGLNNISSLALSGYSNPFTAAVIQPRTVGVSLSAAF